MNNVVKENVVFYGGVAVVATVLYFIFKNELKKGAKLVEETVDDLKQVSAGGDPTTTAGKLSLYSGTIILDTVSGGAVSRNNDEYEQLKNGTLFPAPTQAEIDRARQERQERLQPRKPFQWFGKF